MRAAIQKELLAKEKAKKEVGGLMQGGAGRGAGGARGEQVGQHG